MDAVKIGDMCSDRLHMDQTVVQTFSLWVDSSTHCYFAPAVGLRGLEAPVLFRVGCGTTVPNGSRGVKEMAGLSLCH